MTISYIEIHLYFEFALRLNISNKIYKIVSKCLVSFGDDFCLPGLAHVTWRPGCHILMTHTHTISMCAHISCV